MEKGTAVDIKEVCKLSCSKNTKMMVSQLEKDVFLFTHIPQNGSYIRCPDGTEKPILHNISVGSLKIRINCGCEILIKTQKQQRYFKKFANLNF